MKVTFCLKILYFLPKLVFIFKTFMIIFHICLVSFCAFAKYAQSTSGYLPYSHKQISRNSKHYDNLTFFMLKIFHMVFAGYLLLTTKV